MCENETYCRYASCPHIKPSKLTLAFVGIPSVGDIPLGAAGVAGVRLAKCETYFIPTSLKMAQILSFSLEVA